MAQRFWYAVAAACAVSLLAGCTSSGSGGSGSTGKTTATLVPYSLNGTPPTAAQLHDAAGIIARRFSEAALPVPAITVTSDQKLSLVEESKITQDELQAMVDLELLTIRPLVSTTQSVSVDTSIPEDTTAPPADPNPVLGQVKSKVGADVYSLATSLTKPPTDQATLQKLQPFGNLTPAEVAVLPPSVQFNVPSVSCAQLDSRNSYYLSAAAYSSAQVVACDSSATTTKYLLGKAGVVGSDISGASALNEATSGGWSVSVSFTQAGSQKWATFTDNESGSQIAIVVGDLVTATPIIQAQILGSATVTGVAVSGEYANQLAGVLDPGALPLGFTISGYQSS